MAAYQRERRKRARLLVTPASDHVTPAFIASPVTPVTPTFVTIPVTPDDRDAVIEKLRKRVEFLEKSLEAAVEIKESQKKASPYRL